MTKDTRLRGSGYIHVFRCAVEDKLMERLKKE